MNVTRESNQLSKADLLSPQQLAELLSIPLATVYLWVALFTPLLLSLSMVIMQKPLLSVAWISALMSGLALIIIAVVGQNVPPDRLLILNLTLPPNTFTAFLVAGVMLARPMSGAPAPAPAARLFLSRQQKFAELRWGV